MTQSDKPKSAFFFDYPAGDGDVYPKAARDRISALTDVYPETINAKNFDEHAPDLTNVEVIFATWGMMRFEDRHFKAMPKLKVVFYAAGNVRAFAQPLVDRGIVLVSAWEANAIPVAEMCLSQILLSLRGYFRSVRQFRETRQLSAKDFPRCGVNGETVGMLGMGKIGTRLHRLLRDYPLKVIAYDPFLTGERARSLDIESVSIAEVFERSAVVCNHIPDLPDTRGILTARYFRSMRDGATFINTGRGAQIDEAGLIQVMRDRPDLTALLDVTMPEPPSAGSYFWVLPNVINSPHIGGTIGDEVTRLSDLVIKEFERWNAGQPLQHEVTAEILATMG